MSLGELLKERLGRIKLERQRGFADRHGGGLLSHLLPLQVALKRVEEESVMWYAVPVEDLLLLLCSNAIVLVEEIQETRLGLLEGGIGTRLQIPEIRKDTLFELLGVLDRPSKRLKTKGKASNNVGTGDVKEIVPTDS